MFNGFKKSYVFQLTLFAIASIALTACGGATLEIDPDSNENPNEEEAAQIIPGGNSWVDSYSVDGKCYCASTYDHGIGDFTFETPAGTKTVVEICEAIGAGPGRGTNPGYNTVQCGHAPGHSETGSYNYTDGESRVVADEIECPGRVDIGPEGCNELGPTWDLSVFGELNPNEVERITIPATIEAENFSIQSGIETQDTSDVNGGKQVGFIQNGDFTEYQIYVPSTDIYTVSARVSSDTDGGSINLVSDNTSIGSVSIPGTGGWNNYRTVSSNLELEEGNHTVRLNFTGDNGYLFNLNLISIETMVEEDWTVSTLAELRDAVKGDNQQIKMKPGNYSIAELEDNDSRYFLISGNDNTIDLTGFYLEGPVHESTPEAYFHFSGEGNTMINGIIENTYQSGITEITDYVAYNTEREYLANGGKPHVVIAGNDTTIIGTKFIVRGSFPYGYGSYFGIGGSNTYGLDKRSAIQVNSTNTIIDGVDIKMEALSHAIYIGPGEGAVTDNTMIRNTSIEGVIRLTSDMRNDSGDDSLVVRNNYLDNDGNEFPENDAESLSEDGIRSYADSGSVFVENSSVKGMRSGIRLWLGTETSVKNTIATDNRIANVSMNRDGVVEGVSANFTYGPALLVDGSEQNQTIDMTILASPDAVGPHNIADIKRESTIILRRSEGTPEDTDEDRVILVTSDNAKITNYTEYTIELESGTTGNEIISAGDVIDNGNNDVSSIELEL